MSSLWYPISFPLNSRNVEREGNGRSIEGWNCTMEEIKAVNHFGIGRWRWSPAKHSNTHNSLWLRRVWDSKWDAPEWEENYDILYPCLPWLLCNCFNSSLLYITILGVKPTLGDYHVVWFGPLGTPDLVQNRCPRFDVSVITVQCPIFASTSIKVMAIMPTSHKSKLIHKEICSQVVQVKKMNLDMEWRMQPSWILRAQLSPLGTGGRGSKVALDRWHCQIATWWSNQCYLQKQLTWGHLLPLLFGLLGGQFIYIL